MSTKLLIVVVALGATKPSSGEVTTIVFFGINEMVASVKNHKFYPLFVCTCVGSYCLNTSLAPSNFLMLKLSCVYAAPGLSFLDLQCSTTSRDEVASPLCASCQSETKLVPLLQRVAPRPSNLRKMSLQLQRADLFFVWKQVSLTNQSAEHSENSTAHQMQLHIWP